MFMFVSLEMEAVEMVIIKKGSVVHDGTVASDSKSVAGVISRLNFLLGNN